MAKKVSKKKSKELSGYVFVGFFFLGLVAGAIYGRYDLGALAGLAMGFIASALVRMKY
ncbi:MAG: hypothetical protein GTN40_03210 [Candidatus Aenigmarchaeota archaeon]|nr:hypothetical protein [Candidatus Aenigmarchaeota archaeon]